ncbi:DUF2383 domain-containing protein [Fulvivirga lutea]|uniref:DUF2383 domain-containing protein n=1 Tax=Fulvivirga lutea TaxID=2810512 RepID=A0A974WGY3_9BACT|nr:DUF2383 domain-containing protein [Fulvivirga lutea]QSE95900.1 DUF2383 domain-containing protein [Fulvivirga lutea]
MNNKKTKIKQLIKKLKMAEEIYKRASIKVHDRPMTEYFAALANKKNGFIDTLVANSQLGQENVSIGVKDRFRVEMEKIGIEVNSILIRLNEFELMDFCIKREEELVSMYQNVLNEYDDQDFVEKMILDQLVYSKDILIRLNEKKDTYEYKY